MAAADRRDAGDAGGVGQLAGRARGVRAVVVRARPRPGPGAPRDRARRLDGPLVNRVRRRRRSPGPRAVASGGHARDRGRQHRVRGRDDLVRDARRPHHRL